MEGVNLYGSRMGYHVNILLATMDTSIYISEIKDHLFDPSTYKELNSHPTQVIRKMSFPPLIIFTTLAA